MYRCGFIVGGIYAVFYLFQGLFGLNFLFSRRNKETKYFFLVSTIGYYSMLAMLDIAMFAFAGCYACLYFLSISPIVTKENQISELKEAGGEHA